MRNTTLSNLFTLSTIALSSVLLSSCGDSQAQGGGGMHPASVAVQNMKLQSVDYSLTLPATLVADKEVEIRARVNGIIEQRNFIEGQYVEVNSSLFTIDSKPYTLEVAREQAEMKAAEARLAQAEKTVKRLAPLRTKNTVSQQQYDDAVSQRDVLIADLKAAKVRLQQAELNLEYSKVKAPISGIVGREQVSVGNYISGPNQLLTTITQDNPMRVRFGLSEMQQLTLRQQASKNQITLPENNHWRVKLKLADGSYYAHTGEVNFSDVRINTQTGTSEFQAQVSNNQHQLRSGQFVRVELSGAIRHNVFLLPQKAVLDNGTGKYVYLMVTNDKGMTIAKPQPIQVAEWHSANNKADWVVLSGLKENDQVIIEGMARIFFPGMPVQVAGAQAPSKAATK